MNKTLSILVFLAILLGCGLAIQNSGGVICGHCGNSALETTQGELCDDGNTANGDGCNSQCQPETGYICTTVGTLSRCSLVLTNTACGNKVRNSNQQCDDGNRISGDGCTSNCFVEPGHTCQDPSAAQPDLCTYTNVNACGNGILEQNNHETCDDGNTNPGDGCGAQCVVQTHYRCTTEGNSASTCVSIAICGNNIKQPNEQCDNGQVAGCTDCTIDKDYYCTGLQDCSATICYHIPICGDGKKEGKEQCDAGLGSVGCVNCKIVSGYTCTENTDLLSTCVPIPVCGNGLLETGQECDTAGTAGCTTECKIQENYACQASPLGGSICYQCGNNKIEYQEACDNGNKAGCTKCKVDPGYYCINQTDGSSVCVVSVCGNKIKEPLEECDNGNKAGCFSCLIVDGYNCYEDANKMSICKLGTCGNGIKEASEECDNFNALGCIDCKVDPGYDCTEDASMRSTCTIQPVCGNGGKQAGEQCDNGNRPGCVNCTIVAGYSCVENILGYSICTRDPYCGDLIRQAGEECDNGNKTGCINCKVASGYVCQTTNTGLSICAKTVCGDNVIQGTQVCDNGAKAGCPNCTSVESGYECKASGTGSVCTLLPICGDMIRQASHEQCDGGVGATGCTNCKVDAGYSCNEDFYGKSYCYVAVCGNRIKEDHEECDNGNRPGCIGCTIDPGFECTVNAAGASICNITGTCGNNKREFGEECDNGNVTGCVGCTVDFGYQCDEGLRGNSVCIKTVCGDRIKQEGEECDNGRATGCPDCKIARGYQCAQNAVGFSTCTLSTTCGNKVVEGSEQCDNGNQPGCTGCTVDLGYTCSGTSCTPIPAVCNNFIREVGEECDNGGYLGCTNNCKVSVGFACSGVYLSASTCNKIATCGDNALQPSIGEACDDGNTMNNDGCSSSCQVEFGWECPRRAIGYPTICRRVIAEGCGNGIYNPAVERCDDNNNVNGDGCSKYCLVEDNYICEVVGQRSVCALSKVPVGCGDGKVAAGEQCDDGDNDSFDGCSAGCKIEWGWECTVLTQPNVFSQCSKKCGNGFYEPLYRESCDDGNNYNNDGCDAFCQIENGYECPSNVVGQRSRCFEKPPVECGNGVIEEGEECDDGYAYSNDGCSSNCRVESGWQCGGNPSYCFYKPVCGNAVVQPGEFCDDGNEKSGDGCNVQCRVQAGYQCYSAVPAGISTCKRVTPVVCGNGIVEYGQQCDDANTNKYDGCDLCRLITYPVPTPTPTPTPAVCGDSIYQPTNGEGCDNGNKTGCINCVIANGYICINKVGLQSYCYASPVPPTPTPTPQNICGNGRYEPVVGEQCDDGNTANGDGCSSTCTKEAGYVCNIEIGVQSICYYPYTCKFSNYVVPYMTLSPGAINALAGTSLSSARTVLDIIKALIDYDATNALVRIPVLREMDDLIYNADTTEWGIIAYNINACTGYTSL